MDKLNTSHLLALLLLAVNGLFWSRTLSQLDANTEAVKGVKLELAAVNLPELDRRIDALEDKVLLLQARHKDKAVARDEKASKKSIRDDASGAPEGTNTEVFQGGALPGSWPNVPGGGDRRAGEWWGYPAFVDDRRGSRFWLCRGYDGGHVFPSG